MAVAFVQARSYTDHRDVAKPDLIVLHSAESQERPNTAENIAAWFAGPTAPQASAHFVVDSDSIVQCVLLDHRAWHAPGVNDRSIGIELAGKASQTREQWLDAYGQKMLRLAAGLVADLCHVYGIPVRFVGHAGLPSGLPGITTHVEVSLAFPVHSAGHWDPGPQFPVDWFLDQVRLGGGVAA